MNSVTFSKAEYRSCIAPQKIVAFMSNDSRPVFYNLCPCSKYGALSAFPLKVSPDINSYGINIPLLTEISSNLFLTLRLHLQEPDELVQLEQWYSISHIAAMHLQIDSFPCRNRIYPFHMSQYNNCSQYIISR